MIEAKAVYRCNDSSTSCKMNSKLSKGKPVSCTIVAVWEKGYHRCMKGCVRGDMIESERGGARVCEKVCQRGGVRVCERLYM